MIHDDDNEDDEENVRHTSDNPSLSPVQMKMMTVMKKMWDTHLTIRVFLVISSTADATLAVAAEQRLELVLVHLHHQWWWLRWWPSTWSWSWCLCWWWRDWLLELFTSADFDLLSPAVNVQGCGEQMLQSEMFTDGRAFIIVTIMIEIKMAVTMMIKIIDGDDND